MTIAGMSETQKALARRAMGLSYSKTPYRNHHSTHPAADGYPAWREMEAQGFAVGVANPHLAGSARGVQDGVVFSLTYAGAREILDEDQFRAALANCLLPPEPDRPRTVYSSPSM